MNKEIHSEVTGEGQDIILLHGWGMHSGLWGEFKNQLSGNFCIHAIDLPGHGYSKKYRDEFNLVNVSQSIEQYINSLSRPVVVIGWSLGGLVALNMLQSNIRAIQKLVLIASTPCFTRKTGWEDAMEPSVFDGFSESLVSDYKKTLQRFLTLQTRGSEIDRDSLRELKSKLTDRGEPDIAALKAGLKILNETDLRTGKTDATPVMLILGEKDTLVPQSVKDEFIKQFSELELRVVKNAGHAPFISNPDECSNGIKKFINEE